MSQESITFDTHQTLEEISNNIRSFVSSTKGANMVKIQDDPLGGIGTSKADIEVGISGTPGLLSNGQTWGIQVYVTDTGASRHVEIIALGDSLFSRSAAIYSGNGSFLPKESKKKMHDMANRLK